MDRETVLIGYLSKQFTEATGDILAPAYAGVGGDLQHQRVLRQISPRVGGPVGPQHGDVVVRHDGGRAVGRAGRGAGAYRLYAYRLLLTLSHDSGEETGHPLPELTAVPIPDGSIGYDAVVRHVSRTRSGGNFRPPSSARRCPATAWLSNTR